MRYYKGDAVFLIPARVVTDEPDSSDRPSVIALSLSVVHKGNVFILIALLAFFLFHALKIFTFVSCPVSCLLPFIQRLAMKCSF